jgi:hypothetical protein
MNTLTFFKILTAFARRGAGPGSGATWASARRPPHLGEQEELLLF